MGKLVVSQFISLDGVVEDPGGAEEFKYGGWTFKFDRGDDGNKFKLDEVMAADALLLGRVTYDGFAAAWPGRTDEAGFADKFNSMPKFVFSKTLSDPEWNNSTVLSGNVADEVPRLKQQIGRDILVNGSIQLSQSLLKHGLVDELRLMVFPVVLGAGRRLYGDLSDAAKFKLLQATQGGDSLITIYEAAGAGL